MNIDAMGLDAINAELEKRDAARLRGDAFDRPLCKRLMARRALLVAEENAAPWGLSAEEYAKAKALHAEADPGEPLHKTLGKLRTHLLGKMQTAKADAVTVGVKASL